MNNTNNEIQGPLGVGSPAQILQVTYSTSVSGSFVQSSDCTGSQCSPYSYNPALSNTATPDWPSDESDSDTSDDDKKVKFGPHKNVTFSKYTDEFSTSDGSTVRIGFEVTNKTYHGHGGALGLAPSNGKSFNYIDVLYNAKRIQQKLVSWSVVPQESEASLALSGKNNTTTSTTVKFGASIPNATNETLIYMNATGNQWMFSDTSASLNGTTVFSGQKIILSTFGNIFARVSNESFSNLTKALLKADKSFSCNETSGWCGSTNECASASLPNLTITANTTTLNIPALGYLMNGDMDGDSAWKCTLGIRGGMPAKHPVLLGTYFLANYYAEFDYDNLAVGLAPNAYSSWTSSVIYVPSSSDDDDDGLSSGAIAGVVIGCLVGIFLLCGLFYYCYGKYAGKDSAKTSHQTYDRVTDDDEGQLRESLN